MKPKDARRAARELLEHFDKRKNELDRHVRSTQERISCKKGCSACCYQFAMVAFPEAVAVVQHSLDNGTPVEELRATIEEWMKQTPAGVTKEDYWLEQHACRYLDKEAGTCTVYDSRPGACRYYMVSSDPVLCGPVGNGQQVRFINNQRFEFEALNEVGRISEKYGIPVGLTPIPIGSWWALKLLTEGTAEFERALKDPANDEINLNTWYPRFHVLMKEFNASGKRKTIFPLFPG